jgi:hypothetical protein
MIAAFADFLNKTKRDIQFVFTGHRKGWEDLKVEIADLPILHLGFVRPQLLSALYEQAKALVFFSLYEGFGIPLMEAFNAGIPVICSNTTSLPEIGGKGVLSCDPTDPGAMADLMERIVSDVPLRNRLIAEGKKRLLLYSWEQSSQNLFEACRRVANRENQKRGVRPIVLTENHRPLVSIVTPSLNQGRFLKRTIQSVLNQSYPHIEYFVVDGGSTDNSLEILESFGERFSWVSEPDRGQSDAINKGFERSKGEIRAYLNSDDILLPHAVEKVVAHFIKHPDNPNVFRMEFSKFKAELSIRSLLLPGGLYYLDIDALEYNNPGKFLEINGIAFHPTYKDSNRT